MPFKLWGVIGIIDSALPAGLLGYFLLLLYGLALAIIIYRCRLDYRWLSSRQWAVIVGLSLLSMLLNQPFPVRESPNDLITLTPFSAVPFLVAGAMFSPAAAVVVGLFAGVGRLIGQDHTLFIVFHFAFVAALAATLMHQNFKGMVYDGLRHPVVSGTVATASLIVMNVFGGIAAAAGATDPINALDQSLLLAATGFWPMITEGVLGGILVAILLRGLPQLRPKMTPVVTPWARSLRRRLLSQFVLFAAVLAIALLGTVFVVSLDVSTRLVVNQMAHNAQTVSAEIPEFQAHLQQTLASFEGIEALLDNDLDANVKALGQLQRTDPSIGRLILVNPNQTVAASYPEDGSRSAPLNVREREAVAKAFETNAPEMATAESNAQGHILSYVVPVPDTDGETGAVLIGRVPQPSLVNLIVGLQGTVGQGIGFIVDERSRIIAHVDESRLLKKWEPPVEDLTVIRVAPGVPGTAYRAQQETGAGRELVYLLETDSQSWQVVTAVPNSVVLNLALGIGGPLALVLFVTMTFFYAKLASMGRDIVEPITALVEAAKNIAAGGRWVPPPITQRNDEIGLLGQAFGQMHHSNNKRVKELSLLLDVSHHVASEIDIHQGMPTILRGALRGTGAAGARAVVVNPTGNYPQTFGEGPLSDDMAALDRPIMDKLRHTNELILATPTQISTTLEVGQDGLLVPALFAIPLRFHGHFRGVLWLAYRQSHGFDPASRTLLRTLASQASLLVENAHLYAVAEGGRRRLAAVLASTTDAVIVTDQTERVLLINRAMERAFELSANEVIGRPVADVIKTERLIDALTGSNERVPNLEVANQSGKIFYCNVAPILSNDGRAIGRVAVLHDISPLKDIDHLKSDFVAAVSHDLLTPLTFIGGYASMLPLVGELNEEQEEYIEKILRGIDQVKDLVDDLLELGRLEAGVQIEEEEIDIKLLMSDTFAMYRQLARVNGIRLQLEVAPGLPYIVGDLNLIRRALTNLLTNGLKYAPHSGPMYMRAELSGSEVLLSVSDNGPGIPKEEQMRLFEKFFRGRQRGDSEFVKGAGLGLASVKSIAERHGGRAWCESEEGKGSTFYFSLPVPSSPS